MTFKKKLPVQYPLKKNLCYHDRYWVDVSVYSTTLVSCKCGAYAFSTAWPPMFMVQFKYCRMLDFFHSFPHRTPPYRHPSSLGSSRCGVLVSCTPRSGDAASWFHVHRVVYVRRVRSRIPYRTNRLYTENGPCILGVVCSPIQTFFLSY